MIGYILLAKFRHNQAYDPWVEDFKVVFFLLFMIGHVTNFHFFVPIEKPKL